MQEFIQQVTQQLGVQEGEAKAATGGLLNLLKKESKATDFSALLGKLPGAAALMESGPSPSGGKGGILGGLLGMLGGKVGGGAAVMSMFQKSGLSVDKAGSFVGLFIGFAKEKAGGEIVDRILGQVPQLKSLIR